MNITTNVIPRHIIKAWKCCTDYFSCPTDCPLYEDDRDCLLALNKPTRDLINRLKAELEVEKRRADEITINFAFHRAYELAPHDKSEIFFMALDRVDSDGYHFSYELDDDTKHTICVKHTDLR